MGRCPFCRIEEEQLHAANEAETSPSPTRSRRFVQRGSAAVQWLLPIVTLALVPKCPMCFAAYAAMFTGVGMTVTTATYLRQIMIALCVVSLTYMIVAALGRRLLARRANAGT
jgi:hypothetical protein